jgi:integrase
MNEKIETKTWQRVADGIWRRGNSGTLFERPKIGNRWTFRSLNTKSIKPAKDELALRVTKRKTGTEPTAVVRPAVVTTGQVIRCYEKDVYPDRHKQPRQGRTLVVEKANCATLLKFWEHIPTEAVTLATCDRYHEWRKKNIQHGCSGNRTVDLELTTLNNAYLWACRQELVRTNPMSIYRPRYCSDRNVRHCREYMPNDADELHSIVELMFASPRSDTLGWQMLIEAATGLRTIEALQLRSDAKPYEPGWITQDGKSLCVRRAKNQESVNPFVRVHDGLAAILEAHRQWKEYRYPDSPWYFPSYRNEGKCVDICALGQSLRQKRGKLGRKITSHGLRAFYVTIRRSHGIPDIQIAYEIGHTSGGQTLASVYGGVPPHWLAGDGPKMSWLPTGLPAWQKRWPQGFDKINKPKEPESKTVPPLVPLLLASPVAPPHLVHNTDVVGALPHPTPTICNEFCPV